MEPIWHQNGTRMVSKRVLVASRGPPETPFRLGIDFGIDFGSILGAFWLHVGTILGSQAFENEF